VLDLVLCNDVLTSGSSDSTSRTGTASASALSPILTPGDPLTGGGDVAAMSSVSSFSSSRSEDSVELDVCDSISAVGCLFDPLEGSLSPVTSALGFLSDRLTIGWEKLDMAGVDEILVKRD